MANLWLMRYISMINILHNITIYQGWTWIIFRSSDLYRHILFSLDPCFICTDTFPHILTFTACPNTPTAACFHIAFSSQLVESVAWKSSLFQRKITMIFFCESRSCCINETSLEDPQDIGQIIGDDKNS